MLCLANLKRLLCCALLITKWMEHLDNMDMLREGIGLRAYGQKSIGGI